MSGVRFELNGTDVEVEGSGSLLDALREELGVRSVKDGCAPQGQCGCCTVLVDGAPRVSCVTPVRRVAGRSVATVDGLDTETADVWADAMVGCGASQCGFCTPGIVMRLEGLRRSGKPMDTPAIERALAAHVCRCTGWLGIVEAAECVASGTSCAATGGGRDLDAAATRATIEGGPQRVDAAVVLGGVVYGDDDAPSDALVAVPDALGDYHVAESLDAARRAAGLVQGRNTTVAPSAPIECPDGDWAVVLQTGWVEPAYLETDSAWCAPGGAPSDPLANAGAFGGKTRSPVGDDARRLADEHGRTVRVRWSREHVVRHGPKRPPMAIALRSDGTGVVRVARTAGIAAALRRVTDDVVIEEVDLAGPPTSADLRGAGWAELAIARAALSTPPGAPVTITAPDGATATATVTNPGSDAAAIEVRVACGRPLDPTVLRSYCIGAAHQAVGWVTSEGLAVAADGTVGDLTIRSFGIVRPADMPAVAVQIADDDRDPVRGSDAVFAAVAAAVWIAQGLPPTWPTGRPLHSDA